MPTLKTIKENNTLTLKTFGEDTLVIDFKVDEGPFDETVLSDVGADKVEFLSVNFVDCEVVPEVLKYFKKDLKVLSLYTLTDTFDKKFNNLLDELEENGCLVLYYDRAKDKRYTFATALKEILGENRVSDPEEEYPEPYYGTNQFLAVNWEYCRLAPHQKGEVILDAPIHLMKFMRELELLWGVTTLKDPKGLLKEITIERLDFGPALRDFDVSLLIPENIKAVRCHPQNFKNSLADALGKLTNLKVLRYYKKDLTPNENEVFKALQRKGVAVEVYTDIWAEEATPLDD